MCFPTKRALLAAIVTLMGRQGQPVDVFRAMYLAVDVRLGPAIDAEPSDDWVLSFLAENETDDDRKRVGVRLTPKAL
jgi:hypothetical protein